MALPRSIHQDIGKRVSIHPIKATLRAASGRAPRRWLCFAALTVLAGCAAGPLPKLSPPLPAQWRHEVAATQPKPAALRDWWQAFHDPQLDALVQQALADNLDVGAAVERLRAVQILHGHVDAQFLPQLSARTDDPTDPDAKAAYFVAGLDAVWQLPLFGRGESAKRQTQGALDAAAADLRAVRVSLVGEVVHSWLDLRANQQRVRLLGRIVKSRSEQLRQLRVRRRLQLTPATKVDEALAALAQARAALVEPRAAVDASAQRLAVLLGRAEPPSDWLQAAPLPQLGAWQLTSVPADLLRSRPQIALAQAKVLGAAGDAGIARADRFPQVSLGGSLIFAVNTVTHKNSSQDGIVSFGPLINIPLFDWGMRKAAAQSKRHELKAAVLAYRQAVLEGVDAVETAMGNLQQQGERVRQNNLATHALQRSDRAVQIQLALHLASPLQRADSDVILTQAKLAQVDARVGRALAYVALFHALGGAPLPRADTHGLEPGGAP